jgi:hypothetical protein
MDPFAYRVLSSGNIALLDHNGHAVDIVTPVEHSVLLLKFEDEQLFEAEAGARAEAAAEHHFEMRGYYR